MDDESRFGRRSFVIGAVAVGAAAGLAVPAKAAPVTASKALDAAWRDYATRIQAAGRQLTRKGFPTDPWLRAEGYRYLGRLTTYAHSVFVEFDDVESPMLFRAGDDIFSFGATNIDNNYYRAPLDPKGTYRITGDVSGVREILFSVYDGEFVLGKGNVLTELPLSRLQVADGRLELYLGGAPRPANWIPLGSDGVLIGVREFVPDWEKGNWSVPVIERLDVDAGATDLTPSREIAALDKSATYVEANIKTWRQLATTLRDNLPANEYTPPTHPKGGVQGTLYGFCRWHLAPEQALIIEFETPRAVYWSLQAYVLDWLLCLDPRRASSLNDAQAYIGDDGVARFVVAHSDPGVRNWIDTSGLSEGLAQYRYTLSETEPVPTAKVVQLAAVRDHLPKETPAFSPDDRKAQLAARKRGIARRFRV